MPQAVPIPAAQRLETLDVLRGFALLGILAMNIRAMAAPMSAYMYPYALFDHTGTSRGAYLLTSIFFDLKMMGLFAMLFGAGVLLYAGKQTESGRAPTALWFRRMFILLGIGLVHAYFLWGGDILVPYSLCGILLVWWMRNRSARTLFAGSVIMLTVGVGLAIMHSMMWGSMSDADRAAELEMMMPTSAQATSHLNEMLGSYPEFVAANAPDVFMFQTLFFALFFLWRCGGMMLLGMSLLKAGFLDGRWPAATYVRVALIATPLGLAMASFGSAELERIGYTMPDRAAIDIWNYIGSVFASVGYAATLILLVKANAAAALGRRLAAVGQMALTNYLTHSILASALFLAWGFGLAGRFNYAEQLLVVIAIWVAQLVVSPIWLRTFRFGPAEWLWRSLTYGRRQPMRREAIAEARVT